MKKAFLLSFLLVLSACGGKDIELSGGRDGTGGDVLTAVETDGKGVYKIGNPYEINGTWYYPKEDYFYKEEGQASWYGPDFHNGVTANGELYDMHGLTAAHRTLPLPSMVRVTNKANGRTLTLRVNDRGPFVNDRIIDVSKRAAQLLGFYSEGTADVIVEVLPEESRRIKEDMMAAGMFSNHGISPVLPDSYVDDAEGSAAIAVTEIDEVKKTTSHRPDITLKSSVLPAGSYIQVGAFTDYKNAQKVERALKPMGEVHVYQIYVGDNMFYRVRLGPFHNMGDAKGTLSRVKLKGYKDAHIVTEKKPLKTPIGQRFDEAM